MRGFPPYMGVREREVYMGWRHMAIRLWFSGMLKWLNS